MNGRLLLIAALIGGLSGAGAQASVGRTPGAFAVSPSGSAQYSFPIWTPPGIHGVQPSLGITYDSHAGYGLLGPGWNLSGLSTISRCKPTYAQDGVPAPITLTSADGLCLDGNRLRSAGTGVYQTEIANFSQVSVTTNSNGPASFSVQAKNGLTYEYGATTDSSVAACSGCVPYVWALDKVTDRSGNQMTYTYSQSGGSYVPKSIQYTAPSGSTSFPYQVTFTYSTKLASDTNAAFIAGAQIARTQQLSGITVTSSGTTVRQYNLGYATSTGTLRARLTSIQECGGSAGTDCLAATNVGYQDGTAGVASPTTASGSGATNATYFSVDIDGDGRQDLVYAVTSGSNYQWYVQLATTSGYGSPINTGVTTVGTKQFLLDNFDGKIANEILAPGSGSNSGTWYSYKYNGSSFTATSTGTAVISGAQYSAADVDGDGLPDLIDLTLNTNGVAVIAVQLNTSNGGAIAFAGSPTVTNTGPGKGGSIMGDNQLVGSAVKKFDFDGDGRSDLIFQYVINGKNWVAGISARGTAPFIVSTGSLNSGTNISAVNWNDDACTDLVANAQILLSQCNGTSASTLAIPANAAVVALDWDGDGRTDLLVASNNVWQLYRSQGNAVAAGVSTGITVANGTWSVTDKDGDGLDDLLTTDSSYAIDYGIHSGAGIKPDLATSFTDGFGNSVSPSYLTVTQASALSTDQTWPYQNYIGPLYLAVNATFSDPSSNAGATYYKHYYYVAATMNLQGRGFVGFGAQQTYDSRNALWETKDYSRVFPYFGMVTYDVVAQDNLNATPISTVTNTLVFTALDSTPHNQRYFPYVSQSSSAVYEVEGAKNGQLITSGSTSYTFDSYGNATTIASTVTDSDSSSPTYNQQWTSSTVSTISPNVSTWCLNLPTEIDVTQSAVNPTVASIMRHMGYTPDYSMCRQTSQVIEANSNYQLTSAIGYDGWS